MLVALSPGRSFAGDDVHDLAAEKTAWMPLRSSVPNGIRREW
jgi:hypothetical protein